MIMRSSALRIEGTAHRNRRHHGIGEATNGQNVLAAARKGGFDVLVLDMSMPGRSGIELIKLVKAEQSKLRVLGLSMHSEKEYAVRAVKAGASGYLTKSSA